MSDNQKNKFLSSTKPYLVRAFYDWIVDNDCTPYIIVNADYPDVKVPKEYIENNRIVLNIAMRAVNNLQITNNFIDFDARFSGVQQAIYVPVDAIIAIYAHENGRGMIFSDDTPEHEPPTPDSPVKANNRVSPIKNGKPQLKIVK